ncbi:MAG: MBL fold metallo-hydrolase [Patescibacteria group bacterium]
MEITFLAHACFKIKGRDVSILIDPYDPDQVGYSLPKQSADILLVTHDHFDHNYVEGVKDYKLLINGPGEYEKDGVFIQGIPTYHDDVKGEERGKNTMYLIHIDGLSIMHVGDLGHELTQETFEKLSNVDILMVPVGGEYTINAEKAVKVISSIEPGIVIPMHYSTPKLAFADKLAPLEKFLDEMGADGSVTKVDKLKVSKKSDIPEETEVYIVQPSQA